ncbi:MAG: GIY-YIG nuclease family protein [Desulfuromonadaceae bacterium]|nr:GIY-YIG nuclease family protein [Desulfuromonadaceae bacterium]MDD5106626.1 GIY-YIG nuclease family protein [Desulfuromonadaceae bacterium]
MSTEWSVYIIRCPDDTLYTGITTDIDRRFQQHADTRHWAVDRRNAVDIQAWADGCCAGRWLWYQKNFIRAYDLKEMHKPKELLTYGERS